MSKTIDERVVEMRFDNKQFEANAKESIGTLAKLKEALSISTKDSAKSLENLDKVAKGVSLEGMAAGIDALQKRFSTLGIVGMRVIENITDSMMNTLGKGISFVSDSIVSGGIRRAMNLENAHFQLQALLKDETKVQEVMANANTAVDGTAYALDEAAKAASQFAASGIEAGEEMTNALRGVVGVAAMTNADFESISRIFTTVAGNGRLMGDQLLQLGSRGLNAAATIADFVNGVSDGSKEASDEVKALVKNISGGMKVTEMDIREAVSDGQISFKLFSEAMTEAFADSAERANETFTGALSNIKSALARIGAGFISPLVAQNSEVVGLFNAVRERVNDVKKALVFDEEIGNVNALSKQVTDSVLLMAKGAADFIRNVDLSKPMEIFYYWVESVKNLGKGLYSVLRPLGQAFSEVFLSFSADDVIDLSAKIERLTANMRLTEEGSNNLKDAFKGVFSVVKLVVDIFIDLVRIFVPTIQPINTLTGGVLGLAGAIGRSLTTFTQWFRSSATIGKIYDTVSSAVRKAITSFNDFMITISNFMVRVYNMEPVQNLLTRISRGLQRLRGAGAEGIGWLIDKVQELREKIPTLFPVLDERGFEGVVEDAFTSLNNLLDKIGSIDFSKPKAVFESFKNVLKSLLEVLKGNEGLDVFVENLQKFFDELMKAFTLDKLIERIEKIQEVLFGFVDKVKEFLAPLKGVFEDLSLGGIVSTGGGIAMIYAVVKMAKSFEKVANTLALIPSILGSLNGAIKEYQKNLKADTIKKVAAAILMLSAALVLLSFADIKRVMEAAVALSLVAGVLLAGINKFLDVAKRTKTVEDVVFAFSKAANNLAKAVKWKAIGSAFKDFGMAILMIVGSIVAVALMYRKDPEAITMAGDIVEYIAGAMIALLTIGSVLGKFMGDGMGGFAKAAFGVLALSGSLMIAIAALNKLFKMDLPRDWKTKAGILAGLLGGLGLLALVLGKASRETAAYMSTGDLQGGHTSMTSTNTQGKMGSAPILSLAATLYVSVLALQKLFGMDLPKDYKEKIAILAGIFLALAGLIIAVGYASKLAGGAMKAAGTILAMCVLIGVAVAALMILSIFPAERLISGAISLGILLVAVATALYGAGKISSKDNYKSVLAMVLAVGILTASLGALSMMSWGNIAKGVVGLGAIITALAIALSSAGEIQNDKTWLSILAMVGVVLSIMISLVILATQPIEGILAATLALSAVIIVLSSMLKTISSRSGIKMEKMTAFLIATLSVIPIALALRSLANQPWKGLLVATVTMSAVLMAFTVALRAISSRSGIKMEKMTAFLVASLSLIPIAIALSSLAALPWQGLLVGMVALSATLLALSTAMIILSKAKVDIVAIAGFVAGAVALIPIAYALSMLAGESWESLTPALVALSGTMIILALALAVLSAIPLSVAGAVAFAAAAVALIPVAYALNMLTGLKWEDVSEGLKMLAAAMAVIAGAAIVGGIISIPILMLSAALIVFGVAIAAVGIGLVTFVASLVVSLDLLGTLLDNLKEGTLGFFEVGANVVQGIIDGITGGLEELWEVVKGIGQGIIDLLKGKLDENSPSKETEQIGLYADEGLANGITNGEGYIADAIDNVYGDIEDRVDVSGMEDAGENAMQKYLEGIQNKKDSLDDALSSMASGLAAGFGKEDYKGVGEQSSLAFLEGLGIDTSQIEAITNGSLEGLDLSAYGLTGENASLELLNGFGEGMGGFDISSYMSEYTGGMDLSSFTSTGEDASATFVEGFKTASNNTVNDAAADLVQKFCEAISSSFQASIPVITEGFRRQLLVSFAVTNASLTGVGTQAADSWLRGFASKNNDASIVALTFGNNSLKALQLLLSSYSLSGVTSVTKYLDGVKTRQIESYNTGQAMANKVLGGIKSVNFYNAGVAAGQGFADGLKSTMDLASAAGKAIGNAAYEAAKKSLDEHSPSKKMAEVGENAGLGFVNRLMYYVAKAANAGEDLGDATINGISDAISAVSRVITDDMISDPVIRPIVDLTDVQRSISDINGLFNSAIMLNAAYAGGVSQAFSDSRRGNSIRDIQNEGKGNTTNYFNFNQTNNSPSALSRIDIYRQTNNQFSKFKREVESKA